MPSFAPFMLSYQHSYHAGNFADVVKHLTLTRLIHYLCLKDKPVFYLETHAGRGFYDLQDAQANKTGEYQQGIALLWQQRQQLPAVFDPYIDSLNLANSDGKLRFYPGSPALARDHLRQQDRLFCCELHPQEFVQLQQLPRHGKRLFCHKEDGILSLKALLPPPERRGLIFIDPAYEIKKEYKSIPSAIKTAYSHFSGGVFCLWYPLLDPYLNAQLVRQLETITPGNSLRIEFNFSKEANHGMQGCGLWVVNPPYILQAEMDEALYCLTQILNPGASSYTVT